MLIVRTGRNRGVAAFGYPVFALGFEPHLARVLDWVKSIPNLQSAGRQGAFQYPNMHKAMRMGAAAAGAVMEVETGRAP